MNVLLRIFVDGIHGICFWGVGDAHLCAFAWVGYAPRELADNFYTQDWGVIASVTDKLFPESLYGALIESLIKGRVGWRGARAPASGDGIWAFQAPGYPAPSG